MVALLSPSAPAIRCFFDALDFVRPLQFLFILPMLIWPSFIDSGIVGQASILICRDADPQVQGAALRLRIKVGAGRSTDAEGRDVFDACCKLCMI